MYLRPGVGFDLREFELLVVGVHFSYLFSCGRAKHLDDLDKLVDTTVAWEDGLSEQQFGQHTSR